MAEENFIIRQFMPTDLERVVHVNRVCLPENYPHSFFLDLHRRFPKTFLVAEKDGEVIGYIMCRIESPSVFRPKEGHIVSIAVLPEYRRHGIGRALIGRATQAMAEYKARECYLEVRVTNTQAIDFYKKLGFKVTRTCQGYYADGGDAYILTKKI